MIWATVNIWYIAPSHQFLKSVVSFYRFWYISKCNRFFKIVLSFSKPQLNFQKIKISRILLSINLNFGCSSYVTMGPINHLYTSSTAQGGGGSFKNRKPIGEVGCCESGMAKRIHWWTERCLRSPLCLSFSLTIYLPTSLSSVYLSIYRSIYLSLSLFHLITYLRIYLSTYLPI